MCRNLLGIVEDEAPDDADETMERCLFRIKCQTIEISYHEMHVDLLKKWTRVTVTDRMVVTAANRCQTCQKNSATVADSYSRRCDRRLFTEIFSFMSVEQETSKWNLV